MKILMCYPQSYDFEETGRFIDEAFVRAGHQTKVYDDLWRADMKSTTYANKQLVKAVAKYKPDMLFMLKSEGISPESLKKINCAKVLWHPDVRKNVQPWVVDKALECDFFYTMSKGSIPEYEQRLNNAQYLPEACDPKYHFYADNVDNFYKSKVNFIGTVRDSRIDMCKRVIREGFNFKMWGSLSDLSPWDSQILAPYYMRKQLWREFHSYATSGSISVTWDWCPEVELSYSARIYRVMGSRGLYLCKYIKGMEKVFKRGVHCDWYETLDEMSKKIKHYLSRKRKMEKIGLNAQKEVYSKHTFDVRVKKLLADVKKEFGDFT